MNEFDSKALTWDDNPSFIERSKSIAASIRQHIPLNNKMDAFEYGCGTGVLSLNLLPDLRSVMMADSSIGMLEVLKGKVKASGIINMEVVRTDLSFDNIPDKKFDVIYTAMTMHHIDDLDAIFAKFYVMLKPAGFLCIADLDKEDGSFHGPDFTGHKGFDRSEMKDHFSACGLKKINVDTCYEIRREPDLSKAYPVFLMTGQKI
jgi:ubiquinone/menaquinone biosynthesis C-methylase UbiE